MHYIRYSINNKIVTILYGLFLPLMLCIHIVSFFSNNAISLPISVFILFANLFCLLTFTISLINNFSIKIPYKKTLQDGSEPKVAIIIPTYGEDQLIVRKTVESIFTQDYPKAMMYVVISDDAHNPEIKKIVDDFKSYNVFYNLPPLKNSELRKGEGKSGNLNSALEYIYANFPDINFIETRDCDDLATNRNFLRETIAQLISDPKLGFVQTIKDSTTSEGDPFGNKEELFFKRFFFSKNACNSVFSCGSGVIWRKQALIDTNGFSTWNLVEDYQTGIVSTQKYWHGLFIPIVGATSQISPEDIPNHFKQRGTWAMDAMRFMIWGDKSNLSTRQILSFIEPALYYLTSIIVYFFSFMPTLSLIFNIDVVNIDQPILVTVYIGWISLVFLYLVIVSQNLKISTLSILRSLQLFYGLGPLYLNALIKVLKFGKDKKPKYVVTRKHNIYGVYVLWVLPQLLTITLNVLVLIFSLFSVFDTTSGRSLSNVVWAAFYIFMYSKVVSNSFFGWRPSIKFFQRRQKSSQENRNTYMLPV